MSAAPHRTAAWIGRLAAGLLLTGMLALQTAGIETPGPAVIAAATWIILLHVFIGEYVFLRCFHAYSGVHLYLDGFAALLLFGGVLSLHRTALWCVFLAGAFALAIVKYRLVETGLESETLRRYAREKIRWESPAVVLFSGLAVTFDRLPDQSAAVRILEAAVLMAAALFAVWMIGVRHIYRHVVRSRQK